MKRISYSFHILPVTILMILGSLFAPAVTYAYSGQEIMQIYNDFVDVTVSTNSRISSSSSQAENTASVNKLKDANNNTLSKLSNLQAENEQQEQLKKDYVVILEEMNRNLDIILTTQSQEALTSASNEYDRQLAAANQIGTRINEEFGALGDEYRYVFGALTIMFAIFSAGLFIASKISNPLLPSSIEQDKLQSSLFLSSLWPTLGCLITWVWYELTPAGGTFYIFWGPIIIGALIFFKAYLMDYLPQKKHLKRRRSEEAGYIRSAVPDSLHQNTDGNLNYDEQLSARD